MVCPRHHLSYEGLACGACIADANLTALQQHELELIRSAAVGRFGLPVAGVGTYHICRVADPSTGFCGTKLQKKFRRDPVRLSRLREMPNACTKCIGEVDRLLGEI